MRRGIAVFMATLILAGSTLGASAQISPAIEILENGTVRVSYESPAGAAVKLMVEKDGTRFFYDMDTDAESLLPLQSGAGTYRVAILEQKEGNRYRVAQSRKILCSAESFQGTFLSPIDIIDWQPGDPVEAKAFELTEGLETDREKIQAVYTYIINTFDYDYDKINRIADTYVPDPNTMLEEKSGICYDYASTFAAMLRINGIPARLVKGYKNGLDVYHAWNEVYDSETDTWTTVDTTFDAYYLDKGLDYVFAKSAAEYTTDMLY